MNELLAEMKQETPEIVDVERETPLEPDFFDSEFVPTPDQTREHEIKMIVLDEINRELHAAYQDHPYFFKD